MYWTANQEQFACFAALTERFRAQSDICVCILDVFLARKRGQGDRICTLNVIVRTSKCLRHQTVRAMSARSKAVVVNAWYNTSILNLDCLKCARVLEVCLGH